MGKFEVYKDKSGQYRFRLKASNGEIIAGSEAYKQKDSALNGIRSVKENIGSWDHSENDVTTQFKDEAEVTVGQVTLFTGNDNKFHWRLKARNGETIAHSEAYNDKHGAAAGVLSLKNNAETAEIDDQT